MDAPADERKRFDHVACLMSSSVDEVSGKGCLALDIIEQVVPLIFSICLTYFIENSVKESKDMHN